MPQWRLRVTHVELLCGVCIHYVLLSVHTVLLLGEQARLPDGLVRSGCVLAARLGRL